MQKKIYDLPCYKLLQNKEFFKTVHVEYGCIAWNNDIDYCPDCLCEESTERLSALAEKIEQKIIFETVQERKNTPASEYISYEDAMKTAGL